MIGLRGVTVRFGDHVVLDRLDLDLVDRGVTALTGANGSGKTTVGRLLLGLLAPTAGTVEGPGRGRRAAVFQEDRLCEQLSAVANVRLVLPRSVRTADVAADLERVGLDPATLRQPVRELSGGQRRRVAIVRAVRARADLVVLDEPFTGLDVQDKPTIMTYVRERCAGRTTLLITHDRHEAEWFEARWTVLPRGPLPRGPLPGGPLPGARRRAPGPAPAEPRPAPAARPG